MHPASQPGPEKRFSRWHESRKHNGIAAYSLSRFASAEGKKGGECYTLRCGVKLLVEMLEPYRSRVYDPCCGSSGMFVQSVEFIRAHLKGNGDGGRHGAKAKAEISIYDRTTPLGASPTSAESTAL